MSPWEEIGWANNYNKAEKFFSSTKSNIYEQEGSWLFKFKYPKEYSKYLVPKGSVSINGVSLTIADIQDDQNCFTVAIIPYTFNHTNFKHLKEGSYNNVEFDILTKQIVRLNTNR